MIKEASKNQIKEVQYTIYDAHLFFKIIYYQRKKLGKRHRETRFAKQNFMLHEIVTTFSHQLPHSTFRDI